MINFSFLSRFLAHKDIIVRRSIARLFYDHEIEDNTVANMAIESIASFGVKGNPFILRLLSLQNLNPTQLSFLIEKWEKLIKESAANKGSLFSFKRANKEYQDYDPLFKKIFANQKSKTIKDILKQLPPEGLKAVYSRKWKNMIFQDLLKIYSRVPSEQVIDLALQFVEKHKQKPFRSSQFIELQAWIEVLYEKLSKSNQKKILLEKIENYFKFLHLKKKVYTLEAYFYLVSVGCWNMEHLLKDVLKLFKFDCEEIIYEQLLQEAINFNRDDFLSVVYEYYQKHGSSEKSLPYLLKFFYLFPDLDNEPELLWNSEEYLLKMLKNEKEYARQEEICLSLGNIFSKHFVKESLDLIKKRSRFYFIKPFGGNRNLLHERLLVYSLITGENIENIDSFVDNYLENKSTYSKKINNSLFFYKKDNNE